MKNAKILRQKAEALLKNKQSEPGLELLEGNMQRIMQELEVHQVELEMQNMELILAKDQAELTAQKYVNLCDFAPSGYFTLSHDSEIIELNISGARMLGNGQQNLRNRRFGLFVSKDTKTVFNLFLENIFGGKSIETCEIDLESNGKMIKYFHLTGLANEDGEKCLVSMVDITERKLAEQNLLIAYQELFFQNEEKAKRADELLIAKIELAFQNEEKAKRAAELIIAQKEIAYQEELLVANSYLENLINNANAPIVIWDPQFRITRFNHAFELLTGRKEVEVIGQPIEILFPQQFGANSMELIRKSGNGEKPKTIEIEIQDNDGSVRIILWNSATIFEPDGQTAIATIAQGQDITERKAAEQKMVRQSELIAMLLDSIPDIIFYKDTVGVYLGCNPQFAAFVGKTRNEIIGKTDYDLFDKEIADFFRQKDVEMLEQKLPRHNEEWVTYPDGRKVLLDTLKTPYWEGDGNLIGILGISRDITEKNAAEVKLKESETKYKLLFENMVEGFSLQEIITDENGNAVDFRIIDANAAYEFHTGQKPCDAIGKTLLSSMPQADLLQIKRYGNVALTGEPLTFEYYSHTFDRHLRVRAFCPQLGQFATTFEDITASKLAEDTAKQASSRLSLATRVGGVGIWDYDLVHNQLLWDDQMLQLYGIEKENFVGAYQTWLSGVHPDDVVRGNEEIQMAIRGELDFDTEFRVVWPDGTVRNIRARAVVQHDSSGNAISMIGTNWDITEQKALQEKLKSSETNFHTFFDSQDDLIFVGDLNGDILFANNTVSRKLGYSIPELLGKPVINMHPKSKQREAEQIFGEMFAGKRDVCPLPLERRDGTLMPVETHTWFGKWDGEDCIFGISKDLTKEQESLQKFNKIFDNNPALMAISTIPDGIFTEVNQALVTCTGYSKEEIIGKTTAQLGLFVQPDKQLEVAGQLADNGFIHNIELKIKTKQGNILDGIFSGEIIESQGVKYFLTVMIDITESKKLADEIKLQNSLYNIVASISGKMIQSSSDHLNAEINRSLELLGIFNRVDRAYIFELDAARDEINNTFEWCADGISRENNSIQCVPFLFLPLWSEAFLKNEHICIESVEELPIERNVEKEFLGQMGIRSLVIVPMYHGSTLLGSIGFDSVKEKKQWNQQLITLLKIYAGILGGVIQKKKTEAILLKAKKEAEAANKSKSRFLANMSHEIRTPLNAIIGFSQLMNRDKLLTGQSKEYAGSINRAGEHLLSLINDILELTKAESGRVVLNLLNFDLQIMLKDLQSIFKDRVQAKHLRLIFETSPNIPQYIRTDEGKLRQIIINLIGNAIKFTNEGSIVVRTRIEKGNSDTAYLSVEVEDTGAGIAENEKVKIFSAFEQTSSGIKQGSGTGLGLALSRELVILMGGDITVRSEQGKGSIFAFQVEVKDGTTDGIKTKTTKRVVGMAKGQKAVQVLVVDDNEENLKVAINFLKNAGLETVEATNGKEAIEKFGEYFPNLVLMDLRMPVMNGYDAVRHIRSTEIGRLVPIVAISANLFDDEEIELHSLDIQGYIRKPFTEGELFSTIGKLLGIQYIYEDGSPLLSMGYLYDDVAAVGDIAKLPDGLVVEMRGAVAVAGYDELIELIDNIVPDYQALAHYLKVLANNFDWAYLQKIFSKAN